MKFLTYLILLIATTCVGQDSKNVVLLDNWNPDTLLSNSTLVKYNDCWGYTANNQEYAIAGSTEGVHFFQIINNKFVPKGFILGNYSSSLVVHRDIKTFSHYAYAVCDEGPSKLQIIDLSYLPDSVHLVAEIDAGFGRVHNIFIDSVNALLYACSVTPIVGGNPTSLIPMRVFSLADPINPVQVYEGPSGLSQVHDAYVRNNIAYLNCGFDGLRVYDFSNPSSPLFLQNIDIYQDQGYNHQGWLTPDGKKYIFGDETMGMRLKSCSVASNHHVTIEQRFGTNFSNNSVPHNIMTTNEYAFVAYYNEGLRIYDIRNGAKEIAHYDTYPVDFFYKLNGAWGVYSELPSERILVSDRQTGLYLFDFDRSVFLKQLPDNITVFPSLLSSGNEITVKIENNITSEFNVEIISSLGQTVGNAHFSNQTYGQFKLPYLAGIYYLKITYIDYLGDEISDIKKVMLY